MCQACCCPWQVFIAASGGRKSNKKKQPTLTCSHKSFKRASRSSCSEDERNRMNKINFYYSLGKYYTRFSKIPANKKELKVWMTRERRQILQNHCIMCMETETFENSGEKELRSSKNIFFFKEENKQGMLFSLKRKVGWKGKVTEKEQIWGTARVGTYLCRRAFDFEDRVFWVLAHIGLACWALLLRLHIYACLTFFFLIIVWSPAMGYNQIPKDLVCESYLKLMTCSV